MPNFDMSVARPLTKKDWAAVGGPVYPSMSEVGKGASAFVDEMQALGGGLVGLASQGVAQYGPEFAKSYAEEARNWGVNTYRENMEESTAGSQAPKVARIEDINLTEEGGVGRLGDWAVYQGTKGLLTLGSLAFSGGFGGAIAKAAVKPAVKTLAKQALEKGVVKSVAKTQLEAAGKKVTEKSLLEFALRSSSKLNKAGTIGAVAGATAGAFALEGGGAFGQQVTQENISPAEALLPSIGVGVINAALEVLPVYKVAKQLGLVGKMREGIGQVIPKDEKLAAMARRIAGKVLKGAAGTGTAEGITEGIQELVQLGGERWAKDEALFADLSVEKRSQFWNAAAAGALTGAAFGGATGPFVQQPKEVVDEKKGEAEAAAADEAEGQEAATVAGEGDVGGAGAVVESPPAGSTGPAAPALVESEVAAPSVKPQPGDMLPDEKPAESFEATKTELQLADVLSEVELDTTLAQPATVKLLIGQLQKSVDDGALTPAEGYQKALDLYSNAATVEESKPTGAQSVTVDEPTSISADDPNHQLTSGQATVFQDAVIEQIESAYATSLITYDEKSQGLLDTVTYLKAHPAAKFVVEEATGTTLDEFVAYEEALLNKSLPKSIDQEAAEYGAQADAAQQAAAGMVVKLSLDPADTIGEIVSKIALYLSDNSSIPLGAAKSDSDNWVTTFQTGSLEDVESVSAMMKKKYGEPVMKSVYNTYKTVQLKKMAPPQQKATIKAITPENIAQIQTATGVVEQTSVNQAEAPTTESIDTTGWTQVGDQLGSQPGGQYTDPEGNKWYVKYSKTPEHAANELLAGALYNAAGVKIIKPVAVTTQGKPGIAIKWIEGVGPNPAKTKASGSLLNEDFVIDAWLANWDVVGLGYDNIMQPGNIRTDFGGALLFRAQGEPKGNLFGNQVGELNSLLDPAVNAQSALIFKDITLNDLARGAAKLAKITPEKIKALVDQYGPGQPALKTQLAETLIARQKDALSQIVTRVAFEKKEDFTNFEVHGQNENVHNLLTSVNPHDSVWSDINPAYSQYGVLIINPETGKVLLRQPKNNYGGYVWTYAKGGKNLGETPAQAAMRETLEETGKPVRLVGLLPKGFSSGSGSNALFYVGIQKGSDVEIEGETAALKWAKYEDAIPLINETTDFGGKVRDLEILDALFGKSDQNAVSSYQGTPGVQKDTKAHYEGGHFAANNPSYGWASKAWKALTARQRLIVAVADEVAQTQPLAEFTPEKLRAKINRVVLERLENFKKWSAREAGFGGLQGHQGFTLSQIIDGHTKQKGSKDFYKRQQKAIKQLAELGLELKYANGRWKALKPYLGKFQNSLGKYQSDQTVKNILKPLFGLGNKGGFLTAEDAEGPFQTGKNTVVRVFHKTNTAHGVQGDVIRMTKYAGLGYGGGVSLGFYGAETANKTMGKGKTYEFYFHFKNPLVIPRNGIWSSSLFDALSHKALAAGHDGLIMLNTEDDQTGHQFIVLNKGSQVKTTEIENLGYKDEMAYNKSMPPVTVIKSVEQARSEVEQELGANFVRRAEKVGLLNFHDEVGPNGSSAEFDPNTGKIHIYTQSLTEGSTAAQGLHEGSHATLDLLTGGKLAAFSAEVTEQARANPDSIAARAVTMAMTARMSWLADQVGVTHDLWNTDNAQLESERVRIMEEVDTTLKALSEKERVALTDKAAEIQAEETLAYYAQLAHDGKASQGLYRRIVNSVKAGWLLSPVGRAFGAVGVKPKLSDGVAVELARRSTQFALELNETAREIANEVDGTFGVAPVKSPGTDDAEGVDRLQDETVPGSQRAVELLAQTGDRLESRVPLQAQDGSEAWVLESPSMTQMNGLLKRSAAQAKQHGGFFEGIRILGDPRDGTIYAWDAGEELLHNDVAKQMGIDTKAVNIVPYSKQAVTVGQISEAMLEMPIGDRLASMPVQTNTSEFKAWFGGSKVVNEDGKPLTVYHGTQFGGFTIFKPISHFGTSQAANNALLDKKDDRDYMLEVGQVFEADLLARRDPYRAMDDAVYPVYLSLQNPKEVGDLGVSEDWEQAVIEAKAQGFDGFKYKNDIEGGISWVAFEPSQIKSAVGNRGTFAPNSDDILQSHPAALTQSWYTSPVSNAAEEVNSPGLLNRIQHDYVEKFNDLWQKSKAAATKFNLAKSIRSSTQKDFKEQVVNPWRDLIVDLSKALSTPDNKFTVEAANDSYAAWHIVEDKVNLLLARKNANSQSIELEQKLRAYEKTLQLDDPIRVELRAARVELTKGRGNLLKGLNWDGTQPLADDGVTTRTLTADEVKSKLMEKLEQTFDKTIMDTEVWKVHDSIVDVRMAWEAIKNHGAGFATPEFASQRSEVRAEFDARMTADPESAPRDANEIYDRVKGNGLFIQGTETAQEIAKMGRDMLKHGQLITQEESDAMAKEYPHWVPLRRKEYDFDDAVSAQFGKSKGAGKPMLRAGTPEVDPPVHTMQNLFASYDMAVTAAEGNIAREFFAQQIEANPTDWARWFTVSQDKPVVKRYGEYGFVQESKIGGDMQDIPFFRDGVRWLIKPVKKNQRAMSLSAAIQNLDSQELGPVFKLMSKINSWIRWVNISASPAFMLMNMPRDYFTARLNLKGTELAEYSKEVGKEAKISAKQLYKHFMLGQTDQDILDWERAGGRISFVESLRPNDDSWKSIESEIKHRQGTFNFGPGMEANFGPGVGVAVNKARAGLEKIEQMNIIAENVMRYSTWKVARAHGVSVDKAALLSKDVTTNFDRSGRRAQTLGIYWLFYNATVQGNAQVLRNTFKGANKEKLWGALAAVVATAFLNDQLGAALSDDEDRDGRSDWDSTPDWKKEKFGRIAGSNLVWPGDENKFATLPLPWVFNTVWRFGEMLSEATRGKRDAADIPGEMVGMMLNTFNPIGDSDSSLAQMVAPTALDWRVQIWENEDAFGRPLGPTTFPGQEETPDSQLNWMSEPKGYKWLARTVNAITGGTVVEKGLVDWRPSTFRVLADTLAGGGGRFMGQLGTSLYSTAKGEPPPAEKWPGVKTFLFNPADPIEAQLYHERQAKIAQAVKAEKMFKAGPQRDLMELQRVRSEYAGELRMAATAKDTEKQIKQLRKHMRAAQVRGNEVQVKQFKTRIEQVQQRMNKTWRRRVEN